MSEAVEAVHLRTGEVLDRLDEQPPETLAEALDLIHARQVEMRNWQAALESELRRRLKLRQSKHVVFGDWEVEATTSRESVWDPVELEDAMKRLVAEGALRAADTTDVIVREPVVARGKAKALASRLMGDARAAVEAACTWREKPGKLTVTQLPSGIEEAPPVGSREILSSPAGSPRPSPDNTPSAAFSGRLTASAPKLDLDPEELFA